MFIFRRIHIGTKRIRGALKIRFKVEVRTAVILVFRHFQRPTLFFSVFDSIRCDFLLPEGIIQLLKNIARIKWWKERFDQQDQRPALIDRLSDLHQLTVSANKGSGNRRRDRGSRPTISESKGIQGKRGKEQVKGQGRENVHPLHPRHGQAPSIFTKYPLISIFFNIPGMIELTLFCAIMLFSL